jgi:hypothetical protein
MVARFIPVPVGVAKVAAAVRAIALTVPEHREIFSYAAFRSRLTGFFCCEMNEKSGYYTRDNDTSFKPYKPREIFPSVYRVWSARCYPLIFNT